MIVRFYCVRDALAGSYMNPVAIQNDDVAKRSLRMVAAEKEKYYKENWQDIELHYVFSLDTDSGEVTDNEPYCIGRIIDYVNVNEVPDGKNSEN